MVDSSVGQCGYVSEVTHLPEALVVNVRRERELGRLEWSLRRGYGFKTF